MESKTTGLSPGVFAFNLFMSYLLGRLESIRWKLVKQLFFFHVRKHCRFATVLIVCLRLALDH